MSRKEVPRAGLVKAALAGKITNQEGARALRVSVRQFKRLKARFRHEGARGLMHRRRGQPSPRRCPAAVRAEVVRLMTTTYAGFNDVHFTEKLQELHALPVSRATVRRLRLALGRASPRRRRAPQHRSRRPRAPAMGQLVQLDASPCAWFQDRGPMATRHGLIDDATSSPLALWFRPTEDLHGYTTVLEQTCRAYGLPVTLYGDRLNLFRRNDQHWSLAEELRGQQDPTHFGRMLHDLGIGFIAAQSPQAKGRSERLWGTLQDRLVSELRLRAISTLEQANAFLPAFLVDFRRRFAQPPRRARVGLAPGAARPRTPLELSLRSCRRQGQHHPARPPLGADPARPRAALVCGVPRDRARTVRWPARGGLSGYRHRLAADARRALRTQAAQSSEPRAPRAAPGPPHRPAARSRSDGRSAGGWLSRYSPERPNFDAPATLRCPHARAEPSLAHDVLATTTPPSGAPTGVTFSLNS